MPAAAFGRRGVTDESIARRRLALVGEAREAPAPPRHPPRLAETSATVAPASAHRRKSMLVAYFCWLALGLVSGHRFYLGHPVTAICQALLWSASWLALRSELYLAFIPMMFGFIWIVADAAAIPEMVKRANWGEAAERL
ncbi:MAG: TM2 domain-containing protein [Sphingomonadaceae bacterium]|nr:TM2 domain-containing protein [Sphingomonadaceae bacterium]